MIQFEKHWSGLDFKKMCALYVFVCDFECVCASVPSLTFTDRFYLPPAASSLHVTPQHWHEFMLFTKQYRDCNSTCFSLNSNFLSLFFILPCLSFISSDSVCLNSLLPSSPSVSQRKSWIWTIVIGRTFMSSQELWNFSFASFPSPWCPLASSPTSWRQSVSDQL